MKACAGCVRATTKGTVVESSSDGARAVLVVAELLAQGVASGTTCCRWRSPDCAAADRADRRRDWPSWPAPSWTGARWHSRACRPAPPHAAAHDGAAASAERPRGDDHGRGQVARPAPTSRVQGPPGTGKTFTAAHVVAGLVVAEGWRVGVVAQSHAAVEHISTRSSPPGWTRTVVAQEAATAAAETGPRSPGRLRRLPRRAPRHGCVLGGTAWDFTNADRVERGALDLLVIDEAGQYSPREHRSPSRGCRERLLLLGDPQQLPQVSQGTHPEPVDTSALGWLSDGPRTCCRPSSATSSTAAGACIPAVRAGVGLSYEGRLQAHRAARARRASRRRTTPGVHTLPVDHVGNSTESPEEAGASWSTCAGCCRPPVDRRGETRPLAQRDLLVVAPYNAQVELIRASAGPGRAARRARSARSTGSRVSRPRSSSCR